MTSNLGMFPCLGMFPWMLDKGRPQLVLTSFETVGMAAGKSPGIP